MVPKELRSTAQKNRRGGRLRRHTLLPLDDSLYALQASIPT